MDKNESYLPLIHRPGEAQADFGMTVFTENGMKHDGKHLVLSFPYSNGAYLQLNYGENMECLLEGLQNMFEYIGGVPIEIWFDNTSTIVINIIRDGGRNLTDRFVRFQEHYRFTAKFMNPVGKRATLRIKLDTSGAISSFRFRVSPHLRKRTGCCLPIAMKT